MLPFICKEFLLKTFFTVFFFVLFFFTILEKNKQTVKYFLCVVVGLDETFSLQPNTNWAMQFVG